MLILDHQKKTSMHNIFSKFYEKQVSYFGYLSSQKIICVEKKIFFRVINFEEDYRFKIMHNFFFKSDYLLQIFHFIFTSMWQEKPFYIITSCLLTNFFQGIAEIVKLLNDFLLLRKNVVLLLGSSTWVENDFFYNFAWCCCVGIPHTVAIS